LWDELANASETLVGSSVCERLELLLPLLGLATVAIVKWCYCSVFKLWDCVITRRQTKGEERGNRTLASAIALLRTPEELRRWLDDDQELELPDHDLFGEHDRIARRISDLLVTSEKGSAALALIGRLGCGKSTILKFTDYHLKRQSKVHRRTELVFVCLSPFANVDAALQGIIQALVRKLDEHVETTSLGSLPGVYSRAIEGVRGWQGSLLRLVSSVPTAEDVLVRVDEIAAAIKLHLCLVVEDLERFAPLQERSQNDVSLEQHLRLQPIHALLHLVGRTSSLSVIMATTSLRYYFDISKLARHVERVPDLRPQDVEQILRTYQSLCHSVSNQDVLPSNDISLDWGGQTGPEQWDRSKAEGKVRSVPQALAVLTKSPRALKMGLRNAWKVWQALHGEIYINDVTVLSVLREAEPEVFICFDDYIDTLRGGYSTLKLGSNKNEPTPAEKLLNERFEQLCRGDALRASSLEQIKNFLFPQKDNKTPQGVAVSEPVDYWRRYLAVSSEPPSDRDQPVLRAIQNWRDKNDASLINMIVKCEKPMQLIESFHKMFLPDNLIKLLEETVKMLTEQPALRNGLVSESLLTVWRMLGKYESKSPRDLLIKKLEELFEVTICRDLTLAHALRHYFVEGDGKSKPIRLLEDVDEKPIIQTFENLFLKYYGADQDANDHRLVDAIGNGHPYALYWCVWGMPRVANESFDELPFGDSWKAVRKNLLKAAELNPAVVAPALSPFVTRNTSNEFVGETDRYEVNQELTLKLFGDDLDKLASIFMSLPEDSVTPSSIRPRCTACKDWALAHGQTTERAN